MRAAVIGANGYIARSLIHVMSAAGEHTVRAYGREPAHTDGFADYTQVDLLARDETRTIDLDVDVVFMMAGRTGTAEGFDRYDEFVDGNERALLSLLAEYRRQGSRARIVYPSTRLVYQGRSEPIREDDAKEFRTVYAIGKFAGEQYLEQFARAFGIRYCVLRLCVPFGTVVPGATSYGTAEFMLAKARAGEAITLYGDGSPRRTFTDIEALCDVLIRSATAPACENGVFNIGGHAYSLVEVAEIIGERHGVGVQYVDWPPMAAALESGDTVFDSSRLDAAIGPTAFRSIEQWLDEAQ